MRHPARACLLLSCLALVPACRDGGGEPAAVGGGGEPSRNPASPPDGSGLVAIDMAGTWTVRRVELIEVQNTTVLMAPIDGGDMRLADDRALGRDGSEMDRARVERDVGQPVDWFENYVQDRKIMVFGFGLDRLAQQSGMSHFGLIAGSVDQNTLRAQMAMQMQQSGSHPVEFQRWEFDLERNPSAGSAPGGFPVPSLLEQVLEQFRR